MTKIMIVEDDKSLREIYGVRLLAEGYDIVSAGDGEEALAMTIKERPQLIITDLMMPKIGGFDFIDILRSTTETRNIKVIVMTALGSDDHRQRGEAMGADRYLVKSQVGIEDVVRVVHEVLGDASPPKPTPTAPAPPAQAPTPPAQAQPPTIPTQRTPQGVPVPPQPMRPTPPASATIAPQPAPQPQPPSPRPMPQSSFTTPSPPSARQRVIQPINDPTSKVNINELLDRELAREAGVDLNNRPKVATTAQEKAEVANQLQAVESDTPPPPVPPVAIDSQGHLNTANTNQTNPQQASTSQQPPAQPTPQPPVQTDRGQVQAPPARPTVPPPTTPPRPPAANNPTQPSSPQTPPPGNTPNPAV